MSEPGDDINWEMSAMELWDKKIQLERQLEAVREEHGEERDTFGKGFANNRNDS